ncbi:MAG: hydrogenase iron-sulfur subunit [Candidatus Latescibacterota bacterium]|jgi:quinone-modifying oxidoreductase subunit QmoB
METKIGVYICKGCDIGKSVDLDKLTEIATGEMQAAVCKCHDVLCKPEAVESIRADVSGEGLNRVVVAACSQRVFPELFEFGEGVMTDRTNLREQVAWTHAPNDEDTQMLAEDQIRIGITRMRTTEPPDPFVEEISKRILVIGGGMTGMRAAKSAAQAGYEVTLVEKEDRLGGWATRYKKVFPKRPPYNSLEESDVGKLIDDVESDPNITVHTLTEVAKTDGQPGQFSVALRNGGTTSELAVGSIVQATGWRPYDPKNLGHLGYGSSPDIVTNVQMEEMVSRGGIKRPSDGKPIDSIAFIQCAGSRDQDHLPYCSAVCCRVSLKQAMYVREQYPDAKIYIVYKDIRTPSQYERFYAAVQEDEGVFLTKGEVSTVTGEPGGKIAIEVEETLLGEDIRLEADMVVLAAGMVPTTKVEDNPAGETARAEGGESQGGMMADGKKEAESAEKGARILNLSYRQGTDLPTLKYGFPDSHFICFPYETKRTGIFAAGGVRAPMDLASCDNDANGAALKSIQAVESVYRGAALHPRSGDLSYPEFFMPKCTQCKRCTEECPFGAIDEDDKGTPLPNPMRCRRCGVCFGACPERIISFKNYTVNMVSQSIKAISMPEEVEEKPRILVFACENDAIPAIDMAGMRRLQYNALVRIVPLRCLGSMNSVWVGDALASGFDGVMLMGCRKGDDYQCHFVRGSELAEYRMGNVKEKLKQLALEEERVELHEIAINDYNRIPKLFDDFAETINSVGLNPYKDM